MKNERRKTWRCFYCNEVFRSRKTAQAHFGLDGCQADVPACVDPLRADEKTRLTELREAQRYALQCQAESRTAEDKLDDIARELSEYKSITKCTTVHRLRMAADSIQGELVTARALTAAVIAKAPAVYEEVVQGKIAV